MGVVCLLRAPGEVNGWVTDGLNEVERKVLEMVPISSEGSCQLIIALCP